MDLQAHPLASNLLKYGLWDWGGRSCPPPTGPQDPLIPVLLRWQTAEGTEWLHQYSDLPCGLLPTRHRATHH